VSLILIELDGSTQATHSGTRLDRAHSPGFREWFANQEDGLHQGFVVEQRQGNGGLTIRMAVMDSWRLQTTGNGVSMTQDDV